MTEPAPSSTENSADAPLPEAEDKLWATIAHIGGVLGILPSLIIFLALRRRGPRTAIEAKEALNWQITFLVIWLVIEILAALIGGIVVAASSSLGGRPVWAAPIVFELLPAAVWVVNIVFSILGGIAVNSGGSYRYPFAVRLVR